MDDGIRSQKDKKFINKIYKQIKKGQSEIFVVDDKIGSPTYTIDFSKSMIHLINSGQFGLYNQVCEGSCTRFDVANAFIRFLELQDQIKVKKVKSNYFKKSISHHVPSRKTL